MPSPASHTFADQRSIPIWLLGNLSGVSRFVTVEAGRNNVRSAGRTTILSGIQMLSSATKPARLPVRDAMITCEGMVVATAHG
jgi:hypothetical protein